MMMMMMESCVNIKAVVRKVANIKSEGWWREPERDRAKLKNTQDQLESVEGGFFFSSVYRRATEEIDARFF